MGNDLPAEHLDQPPEMWGASAKPTRFHVPPPTPGGRTRLVGRERVLADIVQLLRQGEVPLLNLVGPGGVGKTRLAIAAAQVLTTDFDDGTVFLPLDTIQDSRLVLPTIAAAFGVSDFGDMDISERLQERLKPLNVLLVLDNVAHVVEAVPELSHLLVSCPRLTLLTTSRVVLHVSGEHDFPVDPLTVPSAVELFMSRARAASSKLDLTAEVAATAARICERLDCVPLAIELAAARIPALSPAALLARLDVALPVLTSGARDQPARLRTMRNAIAWSYGLLTPAEQDLFGRLAVFVGSFPLDAAIAGASSRSEALDEILSLVQKSIIQSTGEGADHEPRYRMLETVREFGLEQLASSGSEHAARQDHASWFVGLAEQAEPMLNGRDQVRWQQRLDSELPNIRSALDWSTDNDLSVALRLGASLRQFWVVRGNLSEASRALGRALAADGGTTEQRARALLAAAWVKFAQADAATCLRMANTALELSRQLDDRSGMADALIAVGFCLDHMGQDRHDPRMMEEAVRAMRESRSLSGELGDTRNLALATYGLASVAAGQQDVGTAIALFDEALSGFETCEDWRSVGWTVTRIGVLAASENDTALAASSFARALPVFQALLDWGSAVQIVVHIARLALAVDRPATAVELLAAMEVFRADEGRRATANEREDQESLLDQARRLLRDDDFAAAFARGHSLNLEDALALANSCVQHATTAAPVRSAPPALDAVGLTPREREVLRLLTDGLTDRQIADRLSVRTRTASFHVTNLLGKLGVDSRTAAAIRAIQDGLV